MDFKQELVALVGRPVQEQDTNHLQRTIELKELLEELREAMKLRQEKKKEDEDN